MTKHRIPFAQRAAAGCMAAAAMLLAAPGLRAAPAADALVLASAAFAAGNAIPAEFTCTGADVSPPLAWTGAPPGTKSFALVVDDPDAPDPAAPTRTWVHWVLYNIPPDRTSLGKGAGGSAAVAPARDGRNDWAKAGYGGPCPPIGRHRYFFRLYALDTELPLLEPGTRSQLDAAMQGHVLGSAELVGTFRK